jgi:hypothetical protein
MDVPTLIIAVGLVTQFLKKALEKIHVTVQGKGAVVLSVLVSIGVVLVEVIKTDAALSFALIPVLVQVIIGANAGYGLLKVASGK